MRTAVNSPWRRPATCPGCAAPSLPGQPDCPDCGILLTGTRAAELQWIDGELRRVDAARTWLLDRRAALLAELRELRDAADPSRASAQVPAGSTPASAGPAEPAAASAEPAESSPALSARQPDLPDLPDQPRQRPEVSARTAARLLVAAGAVLVVVAATVFTVADWSHVGPLGRGLILLAVTALVLAAPRELVRRRLQATAEAVASIGLALTIADAYLIGQLDGQPGGPLPIAAGCAVLAVGWAGYGKLIKLQSPRVAAVAMAQLPAPIAAVALGRSPAVTAACVSLALAVTSSADLLASQPGESRRPAAIAARMAGLFTWSGAVMIALGVVVAAPRQGGPLLTCALVGAALAGLVLAPRQTARWYPVRLVAGVSGVLLTAALALPLAKLLPRGWELAAAAFASAVIGWIALGIHTRSAWPFRLFIRHDQSSARIAGIAMPLRMTSAHGPAFTGRPVGELGQPGQRSGGAPRLDLAAAGSAVMLACCALFAVPLGLAVIVPAYRLNPVWAGSASGAVRSAALLPWASTAAVLIVLVLAALACWQIPAARWAASRPVAVAVAALAIGVVPAAAGLTGWPALVVLTAGAAILLAAAVAWRHQLAEPQGPVAVEDQESAKPSRPRGWQLPGVAMASGLILGVLAAAWSLAGRATTIAELAALTVLCAVAAVLARGDRLSVPAAAGALAALVGLAAAVPLAAGWPARYAGFAVLGVAALAIAAATRLRDRLPGPALVLDLGAGPAALLAAGLAAQRADTFAVLAATAALLASSAAWLRTGHRRVVALGAAGVAVLAALTAQWGSLGPALAAPFGELAHAWHAQGAAQAAAAKMAGLPLAVVVLAACLTAVVAAAGAWRGSGRSSLDALAVALPLVATPVGLAGGLSYLVTVGLLLALTLALLAWAAFGASRAPAGAAVIAAALTVAWALAAPAPTLVVLGGLTVAFSLAAWRASQQVVRVGASALSVVTGAALAGCLPLAAGRPLWQAGIAVLVVAVAAQFVAATIAGQRPLPSLAVEITGWLATAAGIAQCLGGLGTASLAVAFAALTCLGVAVRPDRRPALWAGLALAETSWCLLLGRAGAGVPEWYTLPAAVILVALGWRVARIRPGLGSWLAYGPGLALALGPSLIGVWEQAGLIRPVLLGIGAAGVAVAGARLRRQAPLVIGLTVAVVDALHELTPAVSTVIDWLPGWAPFAVIGAVLLWAGATYEARLANLVQLRKTLTAMH